MASAFGLTVKEIIKMAGLASLTVKVMVGPLFLKICMKCQERIYISLERTKNSAGQDMEVFAKDP